MSMSKVLRKAGDLMIWWCPGCGRGHAVRVAELSEPQDNHGPAWSWNADVERPTFAPSVLVTYNGPDAGVDGAPPAICHSFVQEGLIRYLDDCTHALAGQTVPIPEWPTGELA